MRTNGYGLVTVPWPEDDEDDGGEMLDYGRRPCQRVMKW